ncbi:MAG: phosphatase PAP2 family protein [bacterium]
MLSRPALRRILFAVGVAVALAVCYFFLDRPLARAAERIPAGLNPFFHGLSAFAGLPVAFLAGAVMVVMFFIRAYGRDLPRRPMVPLIYLPAAALTASLSAELVKIVLARYRPGLLIDAGLYGFAFWKAGYWFNSFPSGHAAVAFALAGALALAFPRWRGRAFALAGLVAASRVVLNLHYLSDVIAGALLGLGWARLYRRLFARFSLPVNPKEAASD